MRFERNLAGSGGGWQILDGERRQIDVRYQAAQCFPARQSQSIVRCIRCLRAKCAADLPPPEWKWPRPASRQGVTINFISP